MIFRGQCCTELYTITRCAKCVKMKVTLALNVELTCILHEPIKQKKKSLWCLWPDLSIRPAAAFSPPPPLLWWISIYQRNPAPALYCPSMQTRSMENGSAMFDLKTLNDLSFFFYLFLFFLLILCNKHLEKARLVLVLSPSGRTLFCQPSWTIKSTRKWLAPNLLSGVKMAAIGGLDMGIIVRVEGLLTYLLRFN